MNHYVVTLPAVCIISIISYEIIALPFICLYSDILYVMYGSIVFWHLQNECCISHERKKGLFQRYNFITLFKAKPWASLICSYDVPCRMTLT